jgi:hypothetical protein
LSFEEIADWCARVPGTVRRDEALLGQAYTDLRDAMLAGAFGHGARSLVIYFHPDQERVNKRLRFSPEDLQTWLDCYGVDNPLITGEILSRCWLPRGLCRNWFERQGLIWPTIFDPPAELHPPPVSTGEAEGQVVQQADTLSPAPESERANTAAVRAVEPQVAEAISKKRRRNEKRPDIKKAVRELWMKDGRLALPNDGWKALCGAVDQCLEWPRGTCNERTLRRAIKDIEAANR